MCNKILYRFILDMDFYLKICILLKNWPKGTLSSLDPTLMLFRLWEISWRARELPQGLRSTSYRDMMALSRYYDTQLLCIVISTTYKNCRSVVQELYKNYIRTVHELYKSFTRTVQELYIYKSCTRVLQELYKD